MSQKLVASQTFTKVVAAGSIEFKYGQPLSKGDIAALGTKYDECVASGMLVAPEQLREREHLKAQTEKRRLDPNAVNDRTGSPSIDH
jgi:hypothetical protein